MDLINIGKKIANKLLYLYARIRFKTEAWLSPKGILLYLYYYSTLAALMLVLVGKTSIELSMYKVLKSCNELTIPKENWLKASDQIIFLTLEECQALTLDLSNYSIGLQLVTVVLLVIALFSQGLLNKEQILDNFRITHRKFNGKKFSKKSPA